MNPIEHLYIHVPFCVRKCRYCAFFSETATAEKERHYLDALERELRSVKGCLQPRTIYLGGGTPSCLSPGGLERLMRMVSELDCRKLEEFTIEINPGTLTREKVTVLVGGGVNRISLGVQSLDDPILGQLGRIHTMEQALNTYDILRTAGFKNINLDIIFGVPGQSLNNLQKTLLKLIQLGSEHLSCYEMTYEPGTPLTQWAERTGYQADELLCCQMYDEILEQLEDAGLMRYEISNFARSGRECQHNIAYWRGVDYYGAGPAACSLIEGVRYTYPRKLQLYTDAWSEVWPEWRTNPAWEPDEIPPLHRAGEIAAIGLRMTRGWRFDEFRNRTGYEMREHWGEAMEKLCAQGNGEFFEAGAGFRLTRKGLRFADAAAEEFILI